MVQRVQIRRTQTNNNPPADGSLEPGVLFVEMGDPTRLWVGVPAGIVASQKKLLLNTSALVTSVNGATGVVVLNAGDVGALPASGGTVSGNLNVTGDLQKGGVNVSLAGHTHTIANVTGLQTALDGKAASSHTHTIANVTGLQTALDGKAASAHGHAIADVTGLQTALDGKAASAHTHVPGDVGLGSASTPEFAGLNIGHATDTTLARAGAGVLSVEGVNLLLAGRGDTISKGFNVAPNNLGTVTSGTVTPDALNGNYQYYTNNGAHTLAAPANDCAIDILVTNGASAGAITFSGFTVGSQTGSPYTTTNGQRFILSIRRINGVATYSWYALQ